MGRTKVRLQCTWHCLDCEEHGDPDMTMTAANRDAQRHTDATQHATATSMTPRH